jgi:hypothetical protein
VAGISRGERAVLAGLAVLSLAMRAVALFRYRFDSDEPQHLHVAWGWTAGLVQYRDLFDNHAPLFHILTAPILRLVGERADVLLWMRLPMLPLFALVVWGTYVLGSRLYSPRVGVWGALLLSLFPPFFLKSLEYRTDNLWTALWMVALLVMTAPRLPARAFLTGLTLGLALCVSMKTTLLLITLGVAGATARRSLRLPLAFVAGFVVPPAIVAWWFQAHGAWPDLVYCVLRFNELIVVTRHPIAIWVPRLLYVPVMMYIWRLTWTRREEVPFWPYFFAVATAVFLATLVCFWILVSPRDMLPIMPLAAIFFTAAIDRYQGRVRIGVFVCALFALHTANQAEWFRNATLEQITMMRQVLGLSRPGEPLIDLKGETIYRRRPYYYILEFITRHAMEAGLIPDTIEQDVIRARCHVAQADGEFFPLHGRNFMAANFLDMGRLRAAGQWIRDDGIFSIAIPGEYVVVDRHGIIAGQVDGQPNVPRSYEPGLHRWSAAVPGERTAVLWAPALARGYSPFHLRDRAF